MKLPSRLSVNPYENCQLLSYKNKRYIDFALRITQLGRAVAVRARSRPCLSADLNRT